MIFDSEQERDEVLPPGNHYLRLVFSVYVGLAVCGFGLIGNLISVLVWRRLNRKRSESGKTAGVFLIALAAVDSGLLIFFVLVESVQQLDPKINQNYYYVWFYCYIGYPMYFFFIVASIWMVISITYNRFVAVVLPHKTASLNTLKKSYIIIVGTLLFSFLINAPHFLNVRPVKKNGTNTWKAAKTSYGKSRGSDKYDFWGHCMLLVLIPWVSIFILNFVIICKLNAGKKLLKDSVKRKMSKERQTTIILLSVTFSFLMFLIWQCITQCFYMMHFRRQDKKAWWDIDSAYAPARLGVILNSSINFLLYCCTGSMFRKEMFRMLAEWFHCNNYLVLLDTSTTITVTESRPVSPDPGHVNTLKEPIMEKDAV